MSVIVDLAIFPIGKGEGVSAEVARAVRVIRESGLTHHTHAMGTLIEGDLEDVMGVVRRCFIEMTGTGDRVYMTMKADYRKGPMGRLDDKVRSLESKLT